MASSPSVYRMQQLKDDLDRMMERALTAEESLAAKEKEVEELRAQLADSATVVEELNEEVGEIEASPMMTVEQWLEKVRAKRKAKAAEAAEEDAEEEATVKPSTPFATTCATVTSHLRGNPAFYKIKIRPNVKPHARTIASILYAKHGKKAVTSTTDNELREIMETIWSSD